MAKKRLVADLYSYGIYTQWDRGSKRLPKLTNVTTLVEIAPGVEFGYVLTITGGKGKVLAYKIDHPHMVDENGVVMPSFEGTQYIASNSYDFFLGDTVWEPYEQMQGDWVLETRCEGVLLAQKKFRLVLPD